MTTRTSPSVAMDTPRESVVGNIAGEMERAVTELEQAFDAILPGYDEREGEPIRPALDDRFNVLLGRLIRLREMSLEMLTQVGRIR